MLIQRDGEARLRVLHHAIDSGINRIDIASKRGGGKSEQALGWLHPDLSLRLYLFTKIMLDTANSDDVLLRDGVADALDRMREQGLNRVIDFTASGDAASTFSLI
ncbi:MAG: hypothetical protein GTO41_26235 [Burkholderiales bacterium]|nr:hypothetical protein [Burkholderiales bacterium]